MITGDQRPRIPLPENTKTENFFQNLNSNDGDDESETVTTEPLACV